MTIDINDDDYDECNISLFRYSRRQRDTDHKLEDICREFDQFLLDKPDTDNLDTEYDKHLEEQIRAIRIASETTPKEASQGEIPNEELYEDISDGEPDFKAEEDEENSSPSRDCDRE